MDRAEVTERLRADAWNLLYGLERSVRYYRAKSAKLRRNSLLLRFFLLTGVVVEVVLAYRAAEYSWGLWAVLGLGVVMAALAVWDALSQYSRDSVLLSYVGLDCEAVRADAEALWRNIESYRIDLEGAEEEYRNIHSRWERVTERVTLGDDDAVNEKTSRDARAALSSRYAAR